MKLKSLSVLCLLLLVLHFPFSLSKGGSKGGSKSGGGWFGSSSKTSSSSKSSTRSSKKTPSKSQSTSPKQSTNNQQVSRFSYPQSAVAVPGRYGGPGGYPGGYINQNPKNPIMSPHYAGSFGYGGYQTWGGSPFSHRISSMGMYPSYKSRGFGHVAADAAAQAAMTRMALGYGLGRFPRPHFHFHNSRQEHHYNQYMQKKYGSHSTDSNDYSRDYAYSPSSQAQSYDSFMKSCMKRPDLLTEKKKKPQNKPANVPAVVSPVPNSNPVTNATEEDKRNNTDTLKISKASTVRPPNQSLTNPVRPAPPAAGSEEDDDTVSIVEIGYPALIEQMKARRCLELYLDYSAQYMKKLHGQGHRLKMEFQGLLAVVIGIILTLLD